MNILIINHSVKNCGVYQYGKRVGKILEKSKTNNFIYLEIDDETGFRESLCKYKPKVIIYNYLPGTMPWMNENIANELRGSILQLLLVHNVNYPTFFDYYLHQDPDYPSDKTNFAICRPLFNYTPNKNLEYSNLLKISSFGFGFRVKYFDEICRVVNEQLFNRRVDIRLHLTHSYFCENANDIESIKNECLSRITSPNIRLQMTHNFMSDEQMLDFLYESDLNIFFYQDYPSYNGISSTIDYALSVKKPVAICKSRMFSHIIDVQPSICVEDNYLIDIINNGFVPLEGKYNLWTNDRFIDRIENIISEIY